MSQFEKSATYMMRNLSAKTCMFLSEVNFGAYTPQLKFQTT